MITRSKVAQQAVLAEDDYEEPSFFKDLNFQRQLTLWLKFKLKKSVREISELLNKAKSTVQDDIDRWQEFKTFEDLPGRGRKKKIKVQVGKKIEDKQKENRRKSAKAIWKELHTEHSNVNYHNVNDYVNEIFEKVEAKRVIILSNSNKVRRVQFVEQMESWRSVKRDRIVWTDEKLFVHYPQSEKVVLKILENEDPLDFALPRVQQGGGHIMVWGAINSSGTISLVKCNGWINSEKYVEMLEDDILPVLRSRCGNSFILMQDGAKCHTAVNTKDYLSTQKIEILENWPAQSPDLNPIENIWGWMVKKLNEKVYKTMKELEEAIFKLWKEIPVSLVQTYISWLEKKYQYVKATNGALWNKKKAKELGLDLGYD